MVAPIITPYLDAAPCPRVVVDFPFFPANVATVTVFRVADGREFQVRGAVRVPVAGSLSRIDYECPFNMTVSYRAEMFSAVGVSLGFTESTDIGPYSPWVVQRVNRAHGPGATAYRTSGVGFYNDRFTPDTSYTIQSISGTGFATSGKAVRATFTADVPLDRGFHVAGNPQTPTPVLARSVPVTPGETLLLSVFTWNTKNVPVRWVYRFHDGAAWVTPTAVGPSETGTGWRLLAVEVVVPAGVSYMSAMFTAAEAQAAGDVMGATGLYIGPPGEFFSGSSESTDVKRYGWTGEANNSTSVEETRSPSGTVGLASPDTWMQNPLDPGGATKVDLGSGTAPSVTRPTPGAVVYPLGRRVGVVVAEPRLGVAGLAIDIRTRSDADADKVQAIVGDYSTSTVPIVCMRLGGNHQRMRVKQPMFLSVLDLTEVDVNHQWVGDGGELAHTFTGDEVSPPIPGLFIPLLRRKDVNAYFATRAAVRAGNRTRGEVNRRYDIAGVAG